MKFMLRTGTIVTSECRSLRKYADHPSVRVLARDMSTNTKQLFRSLSATLAPPYKFGLANEDLDLMIETMASVHCVHLI